MSKFKPKRTCLPEIKDPIFPCHLGIILFENYPMLNLKNLEYNLETVFTSFFYDIRFIRSSLENKDMYYPTNFSDDLIYHSKTTIELQPTDNFYDIIHQYNEKNGFNIGIGITSLPIFSSSNKDLLFLFGEANRRHRCAIISTFSLENNESRIIKEIIHELGHLIIGTQHCVNRSCVMSYAKSVTDVDFKSSLLCNKCEINIEKLKAENNI